jgi:hypothetical protein
MNERERDLPPSPFADQCDKMKYAFQAILELVQKSDLTPRGRDKMKYAFQAILDLVQKDKPKTLNDAKGTLAIIEVIADSVLDEMGAEQLTDYTWSSGERIPEACFENEPSPCGSKEYKVWLDDLVARLKSLKAEEKLFNEPIREWEEDVLDAKLAMFKRLEQEQKAGDPTQAPSAP